MDKVNNRPILRCMLVCLLLLDLSCFARGNMNLYLPKPEVRALFGVDNMQMYYIRNGVLNNNAIAFKPHVQADKDVMEFVWKATLPENPVLYDLSFPVRSNRTAEIRDNMQDIGSEGWSMIEKPTASIKKTGELPTKEENFTVTVRCTGEKAGETTVRIVFEFRFSDNPKEIIKVELNRLKKCLKSDKKTEVGVSIDENNVVGGGGGKKKNVSKPKVPGQTPPAPVKPEVHDTRNNSQSTVVFYVSISIVTFFIVIASIVVVRVWHSRARKRHDRAAVDACMMSRNGLHHPNQFLRPDLPNNAMVPQHGSGPNSNWMHFTPIINDLGTDIMEIRSKLSGIAVPKSDVTLDEVLQEGTFSRIYRGTLEGNLPVLVKTVTTAASEEQTRLLLFESSLLRGMHHRNILSIKHVVLDGPEPPLVLFPYTKGGNLKRYLRDIKFTDMANCGTLSSRKNYEQASTQDLVEMGIHVACGMTYLAKRGLVHKDIATRNCVIDSDLKVKISDNALSRDLFPADYCCLGDNENRPVRWLAMESLVHKVYSTASDVWSFGVLLWELQSLAAMPYNDIDDFEMSIYLRDGFRLSQPINCPDHLYNIMARCWHYSPDKRPTFSQLLQMLTEFYAELGEYV